MDMSFQKVSIETGPIRDTRRMWNRGVGLASAGLGGLRQDYTWLERR